MVETSALAIGRDVTTYRSVSQDLSSKVQAAAWPRVARQVLREATCAPAERTSRGRGLDGGPATRKLNFLAPCQGLRMGIAGFGMVAERRYNRLA